MHFGDELSGQSFVTVLVPHVHDTFLAICFPGPFVNTALIEDKACRSGAGGGLCVRHPGADGLLGRLELVGELGKRAAGTVEIDDLLAKLGRVRWT